MAKNILCIILKTQISNKKLGIQENMNLEQRAKNRPNKRE